MNRIMEDKITFFVVNNKSIFMPFKYIYPECEKLIEPYDSMYPAKCLAENAGVCPANQNCMEFLVKRVNYIFTEVWPQGEILLGYYKYKDRPNSIRGVLFNKDLSEPRILIMNPSGFQKCKDMSTVFEWGITDEYRDIGTHRNIIPVQSLFK